MSKPKSIRFTCGCLLFALSFIFGASDAFAQAQASSGQISGFVRDNNGGAIPNATVRAVSAQTGLERTATTSEDGNYRFVLLPSGVYNLTAEAGTFETTEVKAGLVTVGQVADINISMGIGGVQETVTISAGGVQTTAPQADSLVSLEAIQNLPINGRRFQDFVTLTPTAQVDPQRGQISLAG